MPFRIGPMELAIVLVIVMIIFGVGKLPEIGSAVGKGIREFKRANSGDDEAKEAKETKDAISEPADSQPSEEKQEAAKQ